MRSKMSAASSLLSIENWIFSVTLCLCVDQLPRYAEPTLIPRKRAGDAPCPVPMTCCGCPLPQFGVPHNVHSSREQMASSEFQNSVVIPEYDGFFTIRARFPFLISQPISQ